MIWTFQLSRLIVKLIETIQNCGLFLVTDFANWDNCNMKIGNLANLVPKLDNDRKYWIGFDVNFKFERVW
jgi:hypothetical protein